MPLSAFHPAVSRWFEGPFAAPTIPAVPSNRVVYRDGVPVAAREGGEVRRLEGDESPPDPELRQAFVRPLSPALKRYLGKAG